MRETERPTCCPDHPIWVALRHYTIGPEDADQPFAARLARENGWSAAHADRVLEEYKRFCFLAATAGHAVTPSHAVDQAWHLHLTYSRDYWDRFCPLVLGRPLHHEPTTGGAGQGRLFFQQYAQTLESYERAFGQRAPEDLWPSAAKHLIDDPRARRGAPFGTTTLEGSGLGRVSPKCRRGHQGRRNNSFDQWMSDFAEWISDLGDSLGAGGGDGASCGGGCGGGCGG